MNKITCIYKESIIYPFVNVEVMKEISYMTQTMWYSGPDIINYVEHYGMAAILNLFLFMLME